MYITKILKILLFNTDNLLINFLLFLWFEILKIKTQKDHQWNNQSRCQQHHEVISRRVSFII